MNGGCAADSSIGHGGGSKEWASSEKSVTLLPSSMTSADSDSSDSMASLRPLVVICGTTGVGKSKLAIELALRLARPSSGRRHPWRGARIINADSMQVYKGMDVITNKVPLDEQQGVEHLLMGFKEPGEQYVVGEWVRDTIRVVSAPTMKLLSGSAQYEPQTR